MYFAVSNAPHCGVRKSPGVCLERTATMFVAVLFMSSANFCKPRTKSMTSCR